MGHGCKEEHVACNKKMYESYKSAVLLEEEKSNVFNVEQDMVQGCGLFLILFSVLMNDLLNKVK